MMRRAKVSLGMTFQRHTMALAILAGVLWSAPLRGQDDTAQTETAGAKPPVKITIAEGAIELMASGTWNEVEPAYNMIEIEFSIPRVEQDKAAADGRLTGMASGGSIEQNLMRWYAQFLQPDGSPTAQAAKVEKFELGELAVHYVDMSGTFLDGAPNNPNKTERPGYRMLAAILETPKNGNYYLKFYGPAATIAAHEEAFKKFVRSAKLLN